MMNENSSTRFSRNLSLIALAPLALGMVAIAAGQAMAGQAVAAPAGEEEARIILRGIERQPASPRAAKQVMARIEEAALQVCGGGAGAYPEVNRVVRRSDCWHKAVKGALAQVASPYLPKATGGQ
jgi:UrcA family protein